MRQIVTPYLYYEDAPAAVDFLDEGVRLPGSRADDRRRRRDARRDGGRRGRGRIYLGAPVGDFRGPATVGSTSLVYVLVDDVDRHYERAKAAGATITEELVDLPFGDRRYSCTDAQGHEWAFATQIADT